MNKINKSYSTPYWN